MPMSLTNIIVIYSDFALLNFCIAIRLYNFNVSYRIKWLSLQFSHTLHLFLDTPKMGES